MKVLTNIIKFILVSILTICLIAIGMITIVYSTILDKTYITSKLEETNFYQETYELVKSNFENYIYQSGLDEEVLNDICSQEKVKNDINIIISNIYSGTKGKIDTSEIAENLNANINKLGIKNSQNQKAIDQFVDQICNEYTETIIHTNYENKLNSEYIKIVDKVVKLNNVVVVATIVVIILLIIMNIIGAMASKLIQDFGIALFATGAFNLTACSIVMSKVNIEGIKIFNDTFSKAVVTIITEVITRIMSLGIGTMAIAIALIVAYAMVKVNKKNKEETTDK